MCGIFGYIGNDDPLSNCLNGLKMLEYRGYDSAGIAGITDNQIVHCKEVGKIDELEKKLLSSNFKKLQIAIGHTRWATHGIANNLNAHPHFDNNHKIALVHNGIIENYMQIKRRLLKENVKFYSDTDTEVITKLIAFNYKNDFFTALKISLKELVGSFALAIINIDNPNTIYAACRESPLTIGYNDKKTESIISSDPNAFAGKHLNILFLKKDEIAIIKKEKINIFHNEHLLTNKIPQKLDFKNLLPDKKGFDHFMLKEIYEQPVTIQKAMMGHLSEEFGTTEFEHVSFSNTELMSTKHIKIIACGTSWHAGCIGSLLLENIARIHTQAEIASEIRYQNPIITNNTLVIAISQSGETADTIAAIKEAKAKGAKILAICNVKNSTIARESDYCLFLKAGPEISVCSTKAFTSQITLLFLFTLYMARLRHLGKNEGQIFINELKKIPEKIKQVLNLSSQIEKMAKKYAKYDNFFYIGRQYMYPTCLEAALKLKEISYLNACGYPGGEIKHGPIALISENYPVIAFCSNKYTQDKIISNLMELKARKAPVLAFAFEGFTDITKVADDVIFLPDTLDELATFPSTVAGQLFAYYIAKEKKTDIDRPRNLAKSVTVE